MTYDEFMQSILTAQEEMLKHKIEANSVTLNGKKYGKLIEDCPPNMKPTIFGMAVKADYTMPDDYDFLVQYEPPQPKTNGNAIRSMSDEELADYISEFCDCDHGRCPIQYWPISCIKGCREAWLKYLVREDD